MLYTFSIIGSSNVGKSVLFNKLTKTKKSLVLNLHETTRDRIYGICEINNYKFILIDTGGFIPDIKKGLIYKISKQTKQAIIESDVTIFLVDGINGLSFNDKTIAEFLKKKNIINILVINKIENENHILNIYDFYELGLGKPCLISALHNKGINNLIKKLFKKVYLKPKLNFNNKKNKKKNNLIIFSIVGQPNVGKSTLINNFLNKNRVITHNIPGTTRDSIEIELKYLKKKYIIIDTAGINKKKKKIIDKFSFIKTLKSIKKSNVVLLLIDATCKISIQDINIINIILKLGKSLVIAFNKCDLLNFKKKKKIKDNFRKKINFLYFVKFFFISSLYSLGLKSLINGINDTYYSSIIKLKSSDLNKILKKAISLHPPSKKKLIKPKLKYAHQGGKNPPIIIIHGNFLNFLEKSYKHYLINFFLKKFLIIGTPLKIKFKNYKNFCNIKKNIYYK